MQNFRRISRKSVLNVNLFFYVNITLRNVFFIFYILQMNREYTNFLEQGTNIYITFMDFTVSKFYGQNKKRTRAESLSIMQLYCKIPREIMRTSRKRDRIKVRYEQFVNLRRRARGRVRRTTQYKICNILLPDSRARRRSRWSNVYTGGRSFCDPV